MDGTAPGMWVRRVGMNEPPRRRVMAAASAAHARERREGEDTRTPDAASDRDVRAAGSAPGEWARRVAAGARGIGRPARAMEVAAVVAGARLTRTAREAGAPEGRARPAPMMRGGEEDDAREPARAAASAAEAGQRRRGAGLDDAREEQRRRLEDFR